MKMWSFSLGLMWTDRSGNENIRGAVVVRCLGDKVKEVRRRWSGWDREGGAGGPRRTAPQHDVFRIRSDSASFDPELTETSGGRHVAKSPGKIP